MGMGVLVLAFVGLISAPFLKNAFDMRKEKNYRETWGSLFWPALFLSMASWFWAVNDNDSSVMVKLIWLGLLGAVLGCVGFVWLGYRFLPQPAPTGISAPQINQPVLQPAASQPPSLTPPRKRTYLRPDAEALTLALLQIYDVLHESVRDSTSIQSFFKYWHRNRRSMLNPPVQDEIVQFKNSLENIARFYSKLQNDLGAVIANNRSYQADLISFVQGAEPDQDLMRDVSDFRLLIVSFEHLDSLSAVSSVIERYNAKIVAGIEQAYQRRVSILAEVEAKIREIQESAQQTDVP